MEDDPIPDNVRERMLELELELAEFQDSSKELEQALEEELHKLEIQNQVLASQNQVKDTKISVLQKKVVELTSEVNSLSNKLTDERNLHEKSLHDLRQKLVATEISNDSMKSYDRVLESKFEIANQMNNELLEKLAMVENDLDLERKKTASQQLLISNLKNQETPARSNARSTSARIRSSVYEENLADGTMLDIGEMLGSDPPSVPQQKMPRSESLTLFQELCVKSEELRQKVGHVNSTLALKLNSTAELSKPKATFTPDDSSCLDSEQSLRTLTTNNPSVSQGPSSRTHSIRRKNSRQEPPKEKGSSQKGLRKMSRSNFKAVIKNLLV